MSPANHHAPLPPTEHPSHRPRIALLGSDRERTQATVDALRPLLTQHADIVLEDLRNNRDISNEQFDWVMVFGGDGSILRAAQQMGDHQRPVLGVNLGKLGFLADLSVSELQRHFIRICASDYQVIEHLMLQCTVKRGEQTLCERLCLNEVAVLGGPPYSILEIDLYVDAKWVTTYSCDGLIVSTPVGSTAHSLSAGGPILRKDLQAVVISPISPHTLTMRPVVDSADCHYEMRVNRRDASATNEQMAVVVDGVVAHALMADDRVLITRATPKFQMMQVAGQEYYQTLREKLGWSGRIRQTADPEADETDRSGN